jgi:ketol-acid reductoisomerase
MPSAKRKNAAIAVLGYGSQGRAIALNLRDSGFRVLLGLKRNSKSRTRARKDKFTEIGTVGEATSQATLIVMALPDHLHGRIYEQEIRENLKPGSTLVFLHGLSVHFGFVKPPRNCDVILLAPHAPGIAVRAKYLGERDLSAFYAVHRDSTGKAAGTAFKLARALGFARKRLVKTTFRNEAVGDLFGEQAVLCGGMAELIIAGFDTLLKNGIPAENAYLEVAYQLDLIIDLIRKFGVEGMYHRISVAARYGSLLNGPRIVDKSTRTRMDKLFREIASGKFPDKLNRLSEDDIRRLDKLIKSRTRAKFEKAARKYSR